MEFLRSPLSQNTVECKACATVKAYLWLTGVGMAHFAILRDRVEYVLFKKSFAWDSKLLILFVCLCAVHCPQFLSIVYFENGVPLVTLMIFFLYVGGARVQGVHAEFWVWQMLIKYKIWIIYSENIPFSGAREMHDENAWWCSEMSRGCA